METSIIYRMEFPCVVIHRTQDTEREPLIESLERSLGFLLQRVEAVNGAQLALHGFPRKHPHEVFPTSPGNIGCTASHIVLLESTLKSAHSHICIFEDDAEATGDVVAYINQMKSREWDILFLGVNEIVEGEQVAEDLWQVTRFWGTHAVIVGRRAMAAILETYTKSIQDGFALPADWLYSWAIRDHGLRAFCPLKNVISQKKGIVSVISGAIRC